MNELLSLSSFKSLVTTTCLNVALKLHLFIINIVNELLQQNSEQKLTKFNRKIYYQIFIYKCKFRIYIFRIIFCNYIDVLVTADIALIPCFVTTITYNTRNTEHINMISTCQKFNKFKETISFFFILLTNIHK